MNNMDLKRWGGYLYYTRPKRSARAILSQKNNIPAFLVNAGKAGFFENKGLTRRFGYGILSSEGG